MISRLEESLQQFRKEVYLLFRGYLELEKPLLLRSDLVDHFEKFCETAAGNTLRDSAIAEMISKSQEAVIQAPSLFFAIRQGVGMWNYFHFHTDDVLCRELPITEFLEIKDSIVLPHKATESWQLTLNLAPFERGFPKLKEPRSIGKGVEFLNRHLSSRLFDKHGKGYEKLLGFLKLHHHEGQQLMLNERVKTVEQLRGALREAQDLMSHKSQDEHWTELEFSLQELGFEPGWGRTIGQTKETMELLSEILEAAGPKTLEEFLRRLPMVFSVAIISPHGFFGQSNVLGKPDTGGQVVYILDQVRALEKQMRLSIENQGLQIEPQIIVLSRLIPEAGNTTCNQHIEPIIGTQNARILRVPFRTEAGEILPDWISRFKLWPYLERYTIDSETEILAELGGRPDLIIGNYSDGNLVATLLAHRLEVTKCTIAHALEKTKYLHSDLYWEGMEDDHHFSCQFTADLISMNAADFIVASTYQEIAGSTDRVGQYESYSSFSLPGLYRVENGIDLFDPKFNIVSPGADAEVFFPFSDKGRRLNELHEELRNLIYGEASKIGRGSLVNQDKPIIFAMSRLDKIKNVAGLLESYGESDRLRSMVNLFIVGGSIDVNDSNDDDERRQIELMHGLMDRYSLDSDVRWVKAQTDKNIVGELYRLVADTGGAFIQPAVFEAFGLTVVEAMSCGLPTFATCYGGPLEIIEDGQSGYHIDPNQKGAIAEVIADFFERCDKDPEQWNSISQGAIARVQSRYTWKLYAKRLLGLARIYGFWKYITNMERQETKHYLEMFYGLMFRPRADKVPPAKH